MSYRFFCLKQSSDLSSSSKRSLATLAYSHCTADDEARRAKFSAHCRHLPALGPGMTFDSSAPARIVLLSCPLCGKQKSAPKHPLLPNLWPCLRPRELPQQSRAVLTCCAAKNEHNGDTKAKTIRASPSDWRTRPSLGRHACLVSLVTFVWPRNLYGTHKLRRNEEDGAIAPVYKERAAVRASLCWARVLRLLTLKFGHIPHPNRLGSFVCKMRKSSLTLGISLLVSPKEVKVRNRNVMP